MLVFVENLGCAKNLVDSEKIIAEFINSGYEITDNPVSAQIIVINTCSFILPAREEAIDIIMDYSTLKQDGKLEKLVVTGCLVDMYKNELRKELTEADYIISIKNMPEFIQKLNANSFYEEKIPRYIVTPKGQAYLKIADGCSRKCSFCTIPSFKGPFNSYSIDELIAEANYLSSKGIKEVNLVAQDLTAYGIDINANLVTLLKELCKIDEIKWLRLLYTYPDGIDNDLMDLIAKNKKICPYIDLPLQHLDNNVLKLMKRWGSYEKYLGLISNLRERIPGIAVRSTLIVGFPGEDENAFQNLYNRVEEIKFDRLGVFEYSDEEGTEAFNLDNKVDGETKSERYHEIMELQMDISAGLLAKRVGTECPALVEDVWEDGERICRSVYEAPEVDGLILVSNSQALPGDFINIKITESQEYDLYAEEI